MKNGYIFIEVLGEMLKSAHSVVFIQVEDKGTFIIYTMLSTFLSQDVRFC